MPVMVKLALVPRILAEAEIIVFYLKELHIFLILI